MNQNRASFQWRYGVVVLLLLGVSAWLAFQALGGKQPQSPEPEQAVGAHAGVEQELVPQQGKVQSPKGSDRIIACTAEDGSTFHTNAASCQDVDLDNQLSVVAAYSPLEVAGETKNCMSELSKGDQAMLFLPRCREAFMEALRIEPYLGLSDDRIGSVRAEQYCDSIASGVANGCMATSAQFCYLEVCQQRLQERAD